VIWIGDICYMQEYERIPYPSKKGHFVYPNGFQCWVKDGAYHREAGPAVIHAKGTKVWYRNGRFVKIEHVS